MRHHLVLSVVLVSALAAPAAWGQNAGQPPRTYSSQLTAAPTAPGPGAGSAGEYTHDGFYLRMALGAARIWDSVKSGTVTECDSQGYCAGGKWEGTAEGFGAATELAFGGTVGRGVVIGGGIYNHIIPSPTASNVKFAGVDQNGEIDFETSVFTLYAPFVDFYFDPNQGLHLEGALGFAMLAAGKGKVSGYEFTSSQTATGFGFMVGFGDEWWVGSQWSLGLLGRLTYASMSATDDNDTDWSHKALVPAILMTATYH